MFIIIILILAVDTIMLGAFAAQCADFQKEVLSYLLPMYALQLVGYAALYRIFRKMQSGKREKLSDRLTRLREENASLKEMLDKKQSELCEPDTPTK